MTLNVLCFQLSFSGTKFQACKVSSYLTIAEGQAVQIKLQSDLLLFLRVLIRNGYKLSQLESEFGFSQFLFSDNLHATPHLLMSDDAHANNPLSKDFHGCSNSIMISSSEREIS